jgi:pentatricopeptide repeat protein
MVEGREMHAEVVKKGLETEPMIGNILIDMYAKCFALLDAQKVFDEIPGRSVIACTAITSGYVECGQSEEALGRLRHMQNEGLLMGIPAFICGLKACRDLRYHTKGRELHVEIIKRGLLDDEVFIGSILIDFYAHCGLPSEAQLVFDRLPVRDVVSWTVLIIGCTEHGNAEDALHYFEEMKRLSINRDAIILVCSLKACTSIGALE